MQKFDFKEREESSSEAANGIVDSHDHSRPHSHNHHR
jgi:hypothetical protein